MVDVMKELDVPDFFEHSPRFMGTFRTLRNIMTEMESHSKGPSSRPSTSGSGGSDASKPEDNVRELCSTVIGEFLQALGQPLQRLPWVPDKFMFDTGSFPLP
jgi:hypothetical protein